jgi:hypothetical protein
MFGEGEEKMTTERYRLLFDGSVATGFTPDQVKLNLAALFKADPSRIEHLFSGSPIVIKDNMDRPMAARYQKAMKRAGAVCRLQAGGKTAHETSADPSRIKDSAPGRSRDIITCPKCGHRQKRTPECARCGIVIQKYLDSKKAVRDDAGGPEAIDDGAFIIYDDGGDLGLSSDEIRLKNIATVVLLAGLILLGLSFYMKDRLPPREEICRELYQWPKQTKSTARQFKLDKGGKIYVIIPIYDYELYGLVVSYYDSTGWWDITHKFLWKDRLNVKDICVVYAQNVITGIYRDMKFKSGSWPCWAKSKNRQAAIRFDEACLSNNHLLSEKKHVTKAIMNAEKGDQVYLRGYLASYSHSMGQFFRSTSTTRSDTGDGACETIYVDDFQILKKSNRLWRLLFTLSAILVGLCIAAVATFYAKELNRGSSRLAGRTDLKLKLKILAQLLFLLLLLYLWASLH